MNDAGLDEPINHAFSEVKNNVSKDKHSRDDGASAGNTPYLESLAHKEKLDIQSPAFSSPKAGQKNFASQQPAWWAASTGFPLLTGAFGPIANAFSICALVETWRVQIQPGRTAATGRSIPDPSWLIAVNAISLACALVANLSLLLNMARRLEFSVAQPITIIGFWVSSVILIVLILLATFVLHDPNREGEVLTQAYFYACWAAGIYQIISYLMCVTFYGAVRRRYDREFKLNTAQRSLMLQTIVFLTYMLLGSLVYSKIEDWKFTDAVYWATFTLLTVGIGDFAPTTHLGRSLLFPYAIFGIVILGLVISSLRSLVVDRGKQNLAARLTDNLRRRLIKEIEILSDREAERKKRLTLLDKDVKQRIAPGPVDDADEEFTRRQAEFEAMRTVQRLSERRQKWMNLLGSVSAWALLWFVGALVFMYTEHDQQDWSYFDGLYFCYTSLLTIGYGDISPVTDAGKAFFVFWALLAVPTLTILISDMGDTVVKVVKDLTIYVGELTILPADEASITDRLRHGIGKIVPGSSTVKQNGKTNGSRVKIDQLANRCSVKNKPSDIPTENNSLRENVPIHDHADEDRKTSPINDVEKQQEELDPASSTPPSSPPPPSTTTTKILKTDTHRYRHLLMCQIRRIHTDTRSPHSKTKKYTYPEWAFFLELLGEDESERRFHRLPEAKERSDGQHKNSRWRSAADDDLDDDRNRNQDENQGQDQDQNKNGERDGDRRVRQWSWIGPQSPLLSDKDEPTLLLELLFERLEQSLEEEIERK